MVTQKPARCEAYSKDGCSVHLVNRTSNLLELLLSRVDVKKLLDRERDENWV